MTLQEAEQEIIRIYKENYWSWRAYINKCINISADVEDILHDVIVNIWSMSEERFAEIDNLYNFMVTSIKNKLVDYHRRKKPVLIPPQYYDGAIEQDDYLERHADNNVNGVYDRDLKDCLDKTLKRLMTESRWELFKMVYIEGRKYIDISRDQNTNINTLLARNYQTVKKLRADPDMNAMYSDMYMHAIL